MKAALEGLLFLIGDEGLTTDQIAEILNIDLLDVINLLDELVLDYDNETRGLMVKKFGSSYKLTTKNVYKHYYEKLLELSSIKNLSQAALETLAIIAYNGPVTRFQVDELRGVQSSQMIRKLVAKEFIKEVGRSDSAGRPYLYQITDQFLDYFGLSSIEELPEVSEIDADDEEVDLYNSNFNMY